MSTISIRKQDVEFCQAVGSIYDNIYCHKSMTTLCSCHTEKTDCSTEFLGKNMEWAKIRMRLHLFRSIEIWWTRNLFALCLGLCHDLSQVCMGSFELQNWIWKVSKSHILNNFQNSVVYFWKFSHSVFLCDIIHLENKSKKWLLTQIKEVFKM